MKHPKASATARAAGMRRGDYGGVKNRPQPQTSRTEAVLELQITPQPLGNVPKSRWKKGSRCPRNAGGTREQGSGESWGQEPGLGADGKE